MVPQLNPLAYSHINLLVFFILVVRGAQLNVNTASENQAVMRSESRALEEFALALNLTTGGGWNKCKTCVFMIERVKKGTNMLLPAICSELHLKYPDAYKDMESMQCHKLLTAINGEANNIRYWLFEGCYKYEVYEAKEWTKPCPSHVICTSLDKYCKELPPEDPFA
eukprot:jgi/Bigna1/73290/fgenesh1_pg.23_\